MKNQKKDLYTVFIFENATRLYFKNKRLHRELGPAIIGYGSTEEKYINLADEKLYTKVFLEDNNDQSKHIILKFSNGLERKMHSPYYYVYCTGYRLNGKTCKENDLKECQILKLKTELNNELHTNKITSQRLKI